MKKYGIKTNRTIGWVPCDIPEDVLLSTRIHLTRDQLSQILPILQKFVDSGRLDER